MNKYFDLHFHPLAKNHLAKKLEKPSGDLNSSDLTRAIPMSKAFKDYTDETILRIVESQSCIDYLRAGKVVLGIAAIAALEFGVASSKGFVADILKSNLKKPISKEYFEAVQEGELSYLSLFLKEIELYRKIRDIKTRKHTKKGSVNLLKRQTEKKTELSDNLPNIFFAIEGGHNLCMKKIGNALDYDEFEAFKADEFFDPSIVIPEDSKNPATVLEKLANSFHDAGLDILYLTLTHLTHIPEQHLATHAFATKSMKHPSFYPFGNGLSELGLEVVEKAYSLKDNMGDNGPVLIDISHLSLKSRIDLYEYRKKSTKNHPRGCEHIPLIASHAGVTGYSINDWKDNLNIKKSVNHVDQGIKTVKVYTKPKVAGYWGSNVKKEFIFNPCTINLMDEDIIKVARSGGIIGVGLNADILGYDSNSTVASDTYEFITTADFITHFPYTSIQSLEYANAEDMKAEEAWLRPARKKMHAISFCFNIVHIMAVIQLKANIGNPENYICIGSDFDGFIEPLKVCGDSRYLKDLEASLKKWLPVAAKKYQKENGGSSDLFEFIKNGSELVRVVEAILYKSGRKFLGKQGYLSDIPQKQSKLSSKAEPI